MLYRYLCLLFSLILTPVASAQTDLTISATAEDASGEAGGRLTLDYTVTNSGNFEIEDVSVGFYFSTDQMLSSNDVLSEREEVDVDENESESDNEQIDIPGSLESGEYFVLVVIDDLEQVTETDETNNTAAIPFTVTGGGGGGGGAADLVVTSASVTPTSAGAGEEVTVSYTLANDGTEQAGASQLAFYLSSDQSLSASDVLAESVSVDEVEAGDSSDDEESITVPSVEPGTYFLLVVADEGNDVAESAENNNTFAIPFTVTETTGSEDAAFSDVLYLDAPAPNPAAGRTTLRYTLGAAGPVRLAVYDLLGRRVAVLVNAVQAAGAHRATWEVRRGLAAGVYVFRLEAAATVQTRRLTVTR